MRVAVLLAIGLFSAAAAIECRDKPHGWLYPWKEGDCVQHFWKCNHEVAHLHRCPGELYFNHHEHKCDHKHVVLECAPDWHHHHHREKYHPHHYREDHEHHGHHYEHYDRPFRPHHYHEKYVHHGHHHHHFKCYGKPDGSYALGHCIHTFAQCSGGVTSYQKCPAGLVYARHGPCVHMEECEKYHHHHHHHHPYHHHEKYEHHHGHYVRHHGHHHEKYEHHGHHHHHFKCYGKPDGSYALGHCIHTFAQCSGGVTSYQKCPAGLVYARHGQCVHMEQCEKYHHLHHGYYHHYDYHHGYPHHHDYHHGYLYHHGHHYYNHHHGYPDHNDHHYDRHHDKHYDYHHHPFDCTHKKDGYHKLGHCQASFVMCSNGLTTKQHCPEDLVFNFHVGTCDYHHNCIKGVQPLAPKITHPKAALSCENRTDGPHHLHSCSSEFYHCWGHQPFSTDCPADLIYNKLIGHCDFKHNVLECGIPVQPVQHHHPHVEHHQHPKPEQFCASKPDGTYVIGCKDHYYTCVASITYKQFCPPTLYYSKSMNQCEIKENVPECKPKSA